MSEENVEIVRNGFDALKENGVEGLLPLIHPGEGSSPAATKPAPARKRRKHDDISL